jgi:CheY-like chemotaxis protein
MTDFYQPKHLIVYADDDPDDLSLVRDSFNKYSRNVDLVTFEEGYGLVRYLASRSSLEAAPCLIIIDINMPGMNGKDTLLKLREIDRYRDTPVVLFTTSSQPEDKAFARAHGAGFMTKPLTYNQMDLITDQFIEHCTDEIKKNIQREIGDR